MSYSTDTWYAQEYMHTIFLIWAHTWKPVHCTVCITHNESSVPWNSHQLSMLKITANLLSLVIQSVYSVHATLVFVFVLQLFPLLPLVLTYLPWSNFRSPCDKPRGHIFSAYSRFSEKLTFHTFWYAQVLVSHRGKKC